jgi:beta-galactosidase GanA
VRGESGAGGAAGRVSQEPALSLHRRVLVPVPWNDALVEGSYLVRSAASRAGTLALTGDTSKPGPLTVWAPAGVDQVTWNGQPVATKVNGDGSLTGTVPGPAPVTLPALTNWKFSSETPEAQPGFDDSSWTLADHPVSNANSPATPVLYASDHGYDHGFVWYRGHFTATGAETGVTLTADGIAPTGAFSVSLNGAFLGSNTAAGPTTATFSFPPAALRPGQDNVIAVLVENTGNPEGPSGEKAGLYSATLAGSTAAVTWRLMGDPGGTTLQDPVRGVMNAAGLAGSDNGWGLPGYPDQDWPGVTLPDSWDARGVPPGIGWYRTSFSRNLPRQGYVPVDVQIGGPGPGAGAADHRAFVYVNGWLIGRYVNNVGPQHQFYVPAGILNDHGGNTPAIAVWGLDGSGGGLDRSRRWPRSPRPRWPRARSRSPRRCATRPASRRALHRDHAGPGAVARGAQPAGHGHVPGWAGRAAVADQRGAGPGPGGEPGGDVQQRRRHRRRRPLPVVCRRWAA